MTKTVFVLGELNVDAIISGSSIHPEPNKEKVGKISRAAVKKIAETKMNDLNATSVEAAMKMVEGTARSMGVEIGG